MIEWTSEYSFASFLVKTVSDVWILFSIIPELKISLLDFIKLCNKSVELFLSEFCLNCYFIKTVSETHNYIVLMGIKNILNRI